MNLENVFLFFPANGARNYNPFSYEFLEPYSNGSCLQYTTCLACMTDALCGWCDPADKCMLRNTSDVSGTLNGTQNGSVAMGQCIGPDKEKILITEPSVCPVCSDHVDCSSCTQVYIVFATLLAGLLKQFWSIDSRCPSVCCLSVCLSVCQLLVKVSNLSKISAMERRTNLKFSLKTILKDFHV